MKNLIIFIASFCLMHDVNAQAPVKDTTKDILYDAIYKNIAAFNIKYALNTFNGAIDNSPFYSTTSFFYDAFLPNYGSKMVFEIYKEISMKYPLEGYDLYEITLEGMRFQNEKYTSVVTGVHPGKYFLIAVDKAFQNIKFISGQFFISAIRADFALNLNDPASLIPYLELKTYSQQVQLIKFIKKRHHKFYYTAFSHAIGKPIEIILDTNKIEYPKMILAK